MREESASIRLFLICFIIYAINCMEKMTFSAVTAAVVSENILTKTEAGTVSAAFWILYALGQMAGGLLIGKIPPMRLLMIGFLGTTLANFGMGFAKTYPLMLFFWAFSGVVQFGVWPSILAILSLRIIPPHRKKSMQYIAYAYCVGSIFSYLVSALFLSVSSWRYVFFVVATIGLIPVLLLFYARKKLFPILKTDTISVKTKNDKVNLRLILSSGFVFFFVIAFIKSLLDNGIKMWMPTILTETYHASPGYTSLLAVILLVFNLLGVGICNLIYKKVRDDECVAMFILFLLILPFTLLLTRLRFIPIFGTTAIMTCITVLLYGTGQLFSLYAPARFFRFTASVGGIVNCFAAAGNVLGSYGNGLIADLYGWDVMLWVWVGLCMIVLASTLLLLPKWKHFLNADRTHLQ